LYQVQAPAEVTTSALLGSFLDNQEAVRRLQQSILEEQALHDSFSAAATEVCGCAAVHCPVLGRQDRHLHWMKSTEEIAIVDACL
jgi:hypothetical protein